MQSIFNSGVPHIGEKILECLDIESIMSLHSANPEIRSYMENYVMGDPIRFDFVQKIKSYLLEEIRSGVWVLGTVVNCQLFVYINMGVCLPFLKNYGAPIVCTRILTSKT